MEEKEEVGALVVQQRRAKINYEGKGILGFM